MKVGYISRRTDSNTRKETFKYIEGNATRRIGVRSDTVKVSFLYGTIPFEDIIANTEDLKKGDIMLINEPFITNDEMKARAERWCEWANSCEHREYSFFGECE